MKIQTVQSNKKYNIRTYGVRELLRRGNLNNGGIAGPSYVNGNNGLTNAWWNILATISVYKKFDTRPHKPAEEAYTWEYPKYVIKGHSFLMK